MSEQTPVTPENNQGKPAKRFLKKLGAVARQWVGEDRENDLEDGDDATAEQESADDVLTEQIYIIDTDALPSRREAIAAEQAVLNQVETFPDVPEVSLPHKSLQGGELAPYDHCQAFDVRTVDEEDTTIPRVEVRFIIVEGGKRIGFTNWVDSDAVLQYNASQALLRADRRERDAMLAVQEERYRKLAEMVSKNPSYRTVRARGDQALRDIQKEVDNRQGREPNWNGN